MGGIGSGRLYRLDTKPATDSFWRLTISYLKKHKYLDVPLQRKGLFVWSQNGEKHTSINYELNTLHEFNPYLRVYYTNIQTQEKYDYQIPLSTTRPNYGGKRWWFHCPVASCGKRVGILYLGKALRCRHCYNLAYHTQNESPPHRMLSRAQKINSQLGGSGRLYDEIKRPKGMHKKTFERKANQMNRLNYIANFAMCHKHGIVRS